MSVHSTFSLVVLAKDSVPRYYDRSTAEILLSEKLPDRKRTEEDLATSVRRLSAMSRSDWFPSKCRSVLDGLPGFDSLRFLSREMATHRKYVSYDMPEYLNADPKEVYGHEELYVLLEHSAIKNAKNDMRRLLTYVAENPQRIAEILGEGNAPDIAAALSEAKVCENLNREAKWGEDGDGIDFFFCALVSICDALTTADEASLIIVYTNVRPM